MEQGWAEAKKTGSVPGRGFGSFWLDAAPCHADGVVVFGGGNLLVAYEATTGKELWRRSDLLGRFTSPLTWRDGGKAWILCAGDKLQILDPRTGKAAWQAGCIAHMTTPAIAGDLVVLRGKDGDGGIAGYRLSASGAKELWRWSKHPPGQANSPVIHQGRVYCAVIVVDDGPNSVFAWVCLDLETGKELAVANVPKGVAGKAWSSAVASNGLLFMTPHNASGRTAMVIRADPENFGYLPLVRFPVDGCNSVAFSLIDGRLYTRALDGISCHDLRRQ